ncbi:MAG: SMP-30/gluconolactonase/LRE family protein [Sphingomonadales bacterium]|jgi:sugar lactone lactonase YvrE
MSEWRVIERTARDTLGEGLFWHAGEGALYWTDIIEQRLWRLDLASGAIRHWPKPETIGWVVARRGGGLLAGLQTGVHRLALDPVTLDRIVDPEPQLPHNRLNDAKCDAAGRLWFGTMPADCEGPSGGLWRLDPDGTLTRWQQDITIANGPAICPSGQRLYHTDSRAGTVWCFDLAADGSLSGQRVFAQFDAGGAPDGMCCDAIGNVWIAFYGGACVRCFAPDGTLLRQIDLPTPQITNVCFAGPGLDRLFATSAADGRPHDPLAGALFELDAGGATGCAPHLFAG